jgi:glutathione S-transferase
MANLKLTYFDFDGGRGEPARLAAFIGGVPFEDHRIGVGDWPSFRDKTPFLAMPVLEVDGKAVTQSNSINRYLGKLGGLYPKDEWQAFLCDEAMDVCEDIGTRIGNTMSLPDAAKKQAREELSAERIPRYLAQLQARLQAAGGEYFADGRLTVADLKVFNLTRWLRSGALD